MRLRRLTELTALVALHRDHIIRAESPVTDASLLEYLKQSRERSRIWRSRLQLLRAERPKEESVSAQLHRFVSEVFANEMLTRVLTAVLVSRDVRRNESLAGPIVRHVLVSVLECRARLLEFLLGSLSPLGVLLRVDRLRRKCERWSDLLIGELARQDDVLEFAVDLQRAAEFRDQRQSPSRLTQPATWALLSTGIRQAVPDYTMTGPGARSQQAIVDAITALLPAQVHGDDWLAMFPRQQPAPGGAAVPRGDGRLHVSQESQERRNRSGDREPSEVRRMVLSFHELLRRTAISRNGGDPPPAPG